MRRALILLGFLPLTGCIWNPTNRQNQESTTPIPLSGWAQNPGQTINFSVRNWSTGSNTWLISTTSSTTADWTTLYPWSYSVWPASPEFWAPQLSYNGLQHSAGRLELIAVAGSTQFVTFSQTAKSCVTSYPGGSAVAAGYNCYDGQSLVAFDNNGVGNLAETTGWSTIPGGGPFVEGSVTWEVGSYPVQGNTIYGIMCYPNPVVPAVKHRAMIINHGWYAGIDDAVRTAFCMTNAANGWVTAMSAYRGERVKLTMPVMIDKLSGGNIELCLGEVTDVLRLTDIVRTRMDVDTDNVLMWGHSHGGCVTERAVERGAKVKAAVALSGPTDFVSWYPTAPGLEYMLGPGVYENLMPKPGAPVYPGPTPIPYTWRSATTFAPDLTARVPDVKMLLLHGAADPGVPASQACQLASAAWGENTQRFHVGGDGTAPSGPILTTAPPGCSQFMWPAGSIPYWSWSDNRYLIVYDYADHGTILDPNKQAFKDFANFVATVFGP